MADRTPIFELHIVPMFRLLDQQHMLRTRSKLDLWDYDSVKGLATQIQIRTTNGTMPTAETGGPWPSEWSALFARWVNGGCRRLLLGAGTNYKLVTSSGKTTLSCDVDVPNQPAGDSQAWFETISVGPPSVYRLCVFPGEAVPPPTDTMSLSITETVDPSSAAGVTVIDLSGSRKVVP